MIWCLRDSVRAHSVSKTWDSLVPTSTDSSLTFYIIQKVSDRRDSISSLQNLYLISFIDIVVCEHSLKLIITAKQPSVWSFLRFLVWDEHRLSISVILCQNDLTIWPTSFVYENIIGYCRINFLSKTSKCCKNIFINYIGFNILHNIFPPRSLFRNTFESACLFLKCRLIV